MSIVLVSDLHLQGVSDPGQQAFIEFVRRLDATELVIVGDLFDLWLVPDGVVPTQALPVIAALHDRVRDGLHVTWLAGNHDPAPDLRELGIHGGAEWRATIAGRRHLAVHGDEGADDGLLNRFVQRALRSRWVGRAATGLGTARVWRLGQWVSQQRRGTHTAAGLHTVLARQVVLADRLLADVDVVIVGHTHAPGSLERPRGRLVNLGDWYEHRTFARLDDDSLVLQHWNGTEAVALSPGPPRRHVELLG